MKINFQHNMSAHCENGVISNLLRYKGIELSEPMIFGIGSGIFFAYLPMMKLNGIPVTAFRPLPGRIFKSVTKSLGIMVHAQKFKDPDKAMQELDKTLEKGIPTGLVVGVYHLTYFPTPYRFHFNAHNIVAYGKEDNEYLISDPVMDDPQTLTPDDLKRVRFAKGIGMPRGKMYYIKSIRKDVDLNKAIIKGLKKTVFVMTKLPGPLIGVSGIAFLSSRIRKWPKKHGKQKASRYLGQIVRMQEEIGTGGAGFRFLFGAFLQEASEHLNIPRLYELSIEMTTIGDKWRSFAVKAGRLCKGRETSENYNEIADLLLEISRDEKKIYQEINKAIK